MSVHRIRWRALGAVVAAVVAASSAGGCAVAGGAAAPDDHAAANRAADTMRAALATTEGAGTARMTVRLYPEAGKGPTATMHTDGVVDFTRKSGEFDRTGFGGSSIPEHMIIANGFRYLRTGTRWTKTAVDAIVVPGKQLAVLNGPIDGARDAGGEQLAGVATRHFTALTDPGNVGMLDDGFLAVDQVRIDVDIDAEGRIRRFDLSALLDPTDQDRAHLSIELSDFGVPVKVVEPDAALVDS